MLMMPVALMFTLYALWTCLWRTHKINTQVVYKWDDPYGPIFLVSCLMLALTIEFFMTVSHYLCYYHYDLYMLSSGMLLLDGTIFDKILLFIKSDRSLSN